MMGQTCPSIRCEVEQVTLQRGETFTVYLNCSPANQQPEQYQVELRVTPKGVIQVFGPTGLTFTSFNDWTELKNSMDATGT